MLENDISTAAALGGGGGCAAVSGERQPVFPCTLASAAFAN